MSMLTITLLLVAALAAIVAVYWVAALVWHGLDVEVATKRTSDSLLAVVLGAVSSGMLIASELLVVLAGILDVFLTAPGTTASILVTVFGFLTLDGILTFQPETWAIVSVLGIAGLMVVSEATDGDVMER